jgi:hypothetical protein
MPAKLKKITRLNNVLQLKLVSNVVSGGGTDPIAHSSAYDNGHQ